MFTLSLALALSLFEWWAVGGNVGTPFNGYGALGGTWARCNRAPMRYRALLPWLLGWMPEKQRLATYVACKCGLLWAALATYQMVAGRGAVLGLALVAALSLEFDYWDSYAELFGIAACLSGLPWLVVVGSVMWGLSRETVLMAPVLAGYSGGLAGLGLGSLGLLAHALMRIWQGRATFYSGAAPVTLRRWNIPDLTMAWERRDTKMALSVLLSAATVVSLVRAPLPPTLSTTRWAACLWLLAGWTMGRARETRIFLPAALWLAAAM